MIYLGVILGAIIGGIACAFLFRHGVKAAYEDGKRAGWADATADILGEGPYFG